MKLVLLAIILGLLACPWCEAQSEDKGCVIELNITGNFLPDRIEPDVANLGGKDMRDNYFAPGKYRLEIAQPGYFPISEDVTIPEGQKVLRIERMMRAKPRRIQLKITHDVSPPENHPPYEITLAQVANPQNTKSVSDGDEIQPGVYLLKIYQTAYELVDERKYVWPAEEPFVIEKELVAKQRRFTFQVSYDIEPPKDLPPCYVILLDKETGFPPCTEVGFINPGEYYLEAQQPGYYFGPRQEIYIAPSEQPYEIRAKGVAKPRPISFECHSHIIAYQAINLGTGKDITFKDKFRPGEEVECLVKFKRYKSARIRVKVLPGEGPFVAVFGPTAKLHKYSFSIQNYLELDKITYAYMLYADSQPIESHLIDTDRLAWTNWKEHHQIIHYKWEYMVWVDPEAKNLVVYAGYMFAEIGFDKVAASGIPKLTEIHISRLIEHLGYVARREERGDAAALDVLASLVSDPAKHAKLKAVPAADIRRLLEYVQGWKLTDPQEQARCKTVIEALEGLAGAR